MGDYLEMFRATLCFAYRFFARRSLVVVDVV